MKLFWNLFSSTSSRAKRIIEDTFGEMTGEYVLEEMDGGASDRAFYRVYLPRLPIGGNGVLMVRPKPFRIEQDDYYQMTELMRRISIPVPIIYQDFSKDGALFLEDIGETHLYDLVRQLSGEKDAIAELYQQAIDHIITLQTKEKQISMEVEARKRAFDADKLLWELDFMMKHFASGFCSWKPGNSDRKTLEQFFHELARQIEALPRVLCHRDYHSRNLMLWNELLYVLDYQDARMGPMVYDIVSLLGDSYVHIGSDLRSELLQYYVTSHPDLTGEDLRSIQEQYSLVALQRHLKHLGTYGYLHEEKKDDWSLPFIERTMRFLESNLQKFDETLKPGEVLGRLFTKARIRLDELGVEPDGGR